MKLWEKSIEDYYLTKKLREITYDWLKEECVKDDRDTGDIKTGLD